MTRITNHDNDDQPGQGQHDQEAGGGARPAEDRANGGRCRGFCYFVIVYCHCHSFEVSLQLFSVTITITMTANLIKGDSTPGEHRERKQE